ncbi:helix-turn-helix transcriptional regulator [Mycobacterium sp. CBMA293]|uniref:helix-turn-helix domain-containing protein n=1 Tax=unclassified Mycolicibacterium TaxID=2636767 RepID=UPI00132CB4BD|nr:MULTISPECIES: XRE family transcriptional regulator [unclassified Mycolicibacterium]MUL45882.1 helix-turn-helix transcriptional regulator [Mycolicibacterium sp. CBMA 360]MUL95229.1 helix-turn-helix transcriptional regulator [Mycolicibacterium sp. CBMA 230]MUL60555.1 helix-turn-helix transcriptional regulator [Mycolicibacterium sp. CBMA 335]MUL72370.1 helix-turn-helix transcriptional regulator [Mycolicibacterium sp. CBMA 311]MUM06952.1 DNA-binding protein [Mycolicibacterium sp. CBMA 213]
MSGLLRTVRQQRGMTLDELAAGTGLTKSYLSKVERGQSVPSIAAAIKISRTLDVDVAQLFSDDPEVSTFTVERASDRGTARHHAIAAGMLGKAMSPFVVRPGRQFAAHSHPTHPGQEFVFVHSGTVELNYDGRLVELAAGDCAYFDATTQHKLRQVGDETAVVVVVTSPAPPRTVH